MLHRGGLNLGGFVWFFFDGCLYVWILGKRAFFLSHHYVPPFEMRPGLGGWGTGSLNRAGCVKVGLTGGLTGPQSLTFFLFFFFSFF